MEMEILKAPKISERRRDNRTRIPSATINMSKIKAASEVENFKRSLQLAMKERHWLERQLAFLTQSLQNNRELNVGKYVQLTKTNQTLIQQVEYLTNLVQHQQNVEKELREREEECIKLQRHLIKKTEECDHLVAELDKAVEKNLELAVFSSEAQQQLQRLQEQMKDVLEQRALLEKEHVSVKVLLQQRQEEVNQLHKSKEKDRQKHSESIEVLQSKLRELEKKCELQNVRHEELVLEMDTLRRTQTKKDIQVHQTIAGQELVHISNGLGILPNSEVNCSSPTTIVNRTSTPSTVPSNQSVSGGDVRTNVALNPNSLQRATTPKAIASDTINEIDRIMAKLEQDNKILAELDRTRASIGLTIGSSSFSTVTGSAGADETSFLNSCSYQAVSSSNITVSATRTSTVVTTANSITSTTICSSSSNSNSGPTSTVLPMLNVSTTSAPTTDHYRTKTATMPVPATGSAMNLPTIITTSADTEVSRNPSDVGSSAPEGLFPKEDNSHLIIPGIGKVQVYIARYSYDPLQHSPNENPEAELPVNAGDYVMVRGDMDEDGFFDGQLLDGRRGLVPSNFVEKLSGDDLSDFHHNVLYAARDSDDSMTSLPPDFSLDSNLDDNEMLIESCLPGDVLCLSNLDNLDEGEEFLQDINDSGPEIFFSALVPPPLNLTMERQFHKSILISWIAPAAPAGSLESFNVYVDGELRLTVLANERPRALIERVDTLRPHRISVRSVTPNRRMSVDAACTMIIGKGVPVAPSCVRASNITSTSAVISWLPSNSNYQHVVCVNSVEVRMVKPGVYRHTITGLSPNTTYRVTVKVKNIKSPFSDEKSVGRLETSSTSVDFRTLPKGLPDPPLDVQVEPGPQDGTLLVTWLPVTITTTGTSNGSQVTGYAVYADGKKVFDNDSPTGDHALLEIGKFQTILPKHVTVRTKSGDSVSPDSVQVSIPSAVVKQARAKIKKKVPEDPVEYQEESSDRSELSDIAEEAEEDVSDVQQSRSTGTKEWKKGGSSCGGSEASVGERSATKKSDSGKVRKEAADSKTSSSKSGSGRTTAHSERRSTQRRHDSVVQTIIEPEENLSDKEVYPSSHISIPAIEITKESSSDRRNQMDYSDDDYPSHRRETRGSSGVMRDGGGRESSSARDKRQMNRESTSYGSGGGGRRSVREGSSSHREQHLHSQRMVRTFVALFDYDPKTMSPNPGAAMEELPFHEGQLIKIHGDKDPDGFYWGEVAGRQGYVPCNMVSQVQGEEEPMPQNRRAVPPPRRTDLQSHRGYPMRKFPGRDRWGDVYEGQPVKKMVALYDYDPQELSPNVDAEKVELSFNTGDVIYVYGDMDEDGFFMGEMNGIRGLVPSNFLTEAPVDYPEEPRRHDHISGSSGKAYDGHSMDRRSAQQDGNKYNHTRSSAQRW